MSAVFQGDTEFAQQVAIGAPGGNIANGNATVGTGEVTLRAANPKRKSIIIYNNHATAKLYIGATGVTTGNAPPVVPGASLILDKGCSDAIKAISDTASTDVRFLEEVNP